jgi:hypothetical protein
LSFIIKRFLELSLRACLQDRKIVSFNKLRLQYITFQRDNKICIGLSILNKNQELGKSWTKKRLIRVYTISS